MTRCPNASQWAYSHIGELCTARTVQPCIASAASFFERSLRVCPLKRLRQSSFWPYFHDTKFILLSREFRITLVCTRPEDNTYFLWDQRNMVFSTIRGSNRRLLNVSYSWLSTCCTLTAPSLVNYMFDVRYFKAQLQDYRYFFLKLAVGLPLHCKG